MYSSEKYSVSWEGANLREITNQCQTEATLEFLQTQKYTAFPGD